ncbi:uncharacterized protein LOC144662372 [Oculina patagonica]
MAEGQIASSKAKLEFDDETLKAIANVYREEGNNEYRKRELSNAVYFYTEGLQVNCKDDELNAKLYSNRATANFYLGNYQEALSDATAAVKLEPTYIKAIERGASACVKLQLYKEAIAWCDKGLAIEETRSKLVDLRTRSIEKLNSPQQTKQQKIKDMSVTHSEEGQESEDSLPKASKDVADINKVTSSHDVLGDSNSTQNYLELTPGNFDITCHRLEYPKMAMDYLEILGNAYEILGDFKTAVDCHERHLQIAKHAGDKAGEGKAYCNLGNAYQDLGKIKSAIDYHELHLKIAKDVGDKAGEGKAYVSIGGAYQRLGNFKTAINYHEHHLKLAKEVGDKSGEGMAYGSLGDSYHRLGDFKRAIDYHELHLNIAKKVRNKAEEGRAYGGLGNAYEGLGEFKKAIGYYERYQKLAKEVGDKVGEGSTYCNLGNAYQSLGDFKAAIQNHECHLKFEKEAGDKAGEGKAYGNLGNAYCSLGDFETAIDYSVRALDFAKDVGDKAEEGRVYGNLGNVYYSRGDIKTAIDYHERHLKIAKEVGNKAEEGSAHGDLGNAHHSLGDFKTAIDYHERHLEIAKEVGDKAGEGKTYCNLGNAYYRLGRFETAMDYYERDLKIAKEVGDKAGEGTAYGNLGNVYHSLGKFKTAIEYNEVCLKITKEVGDKYEEGRAYGKLGNSFQRLGDFKTAINYHARCLKIAIEVGDKVGEGRAYGTLGYTSQSLGDYKTAIDFHERDLKTKQQVGDKAGIATSFYCLGWSFEWQGSPLRALDCYHSSVTMFNNVRRHLKGKDEWKISYRDLNECAHAYTRLWRLSLKQGKVVEALSAAEQGRAQALNDLMELNYGLDTAYHQSNTQDESAYDSFSFLPSTVVFIAIDEREIVFWIVQNGKDVQLRRKEVSNSSSLDLNNFLKSLVATAYKEIGVRAGVKCEDRSLDNLANERSPQTQPNPVGLPENALRTFYDVIIGPIADLINGNELILVPEGPLCLAPYAAFVDPNSRNLCEFCRIRMIPSLTSLKLITECPDGYHSKTGALLVGDPWVQEVVFQGQILGQLPCAKEEVEMIGGILNTEPLIGRQGTKDEVLRRLSSVALVHIAAHGMKTGKIVLAPNTTRTSQIPVEEDFLLTMKDVMSVQIRARLVVLSCCHSGRGEIKAEGVVGIARAFLGAGARSVLVSLWAIDDEATLEFMRSFYSHLAKGKSASESLNQAMKCMRESDDFNEVKYWAPFVLIGDDVTLEFGGSE